MAMNKRGPFRAAASALLSVGLAAAFLLDPFAAHAASADAAAVTWNGNTTTYATMDEAWDQAIYASVNKHPATITLLSDWYPSRPYTLRTGEDFTIDLNGYKIDRRMHGKMSGSGNVFTVCGRLTIIDARPDSTGYSENIRGGVITGGAGDGVGGCIVLDGGELNMTGGSVVGCCSNYHGGALYVGDGSRANISGAGFYSNMVFDSTDSCYGGAIYADKHSTVNITNSIFENNYSEDSGGAVYDDDGTISVSGTLFNGNKCLDDGGAMYFDSEAFSSLSRGTDATVDGCIFENNRSDGSGGAIYCNSDNVTMLLSSTFRYNSAKNGGGVFVNGDNVCLIDTTVVSNTADALGGGVFVDSMVDVNLQGSDRIISNKRSGGVRDNLYLSEGRFSSARIFNGGLADGSVIGVGTKGGSEKYAAVELTSEYQTRYFESDMGDMGLTFSVRDSEAQTEYLIASAVGNNGSPLVPAAAAAALAAAAAILAVIIKQKKKKEGKKDER